MVMKSQLIYSDFYSRYGLSHILKLQFISGPEKLKAVETSREQLKLVPLKYKPQYMRDPLMYRKKILSGKQKTCQ